MPLKRVRIRPYRLPLRRTWLSAADGFDTRCGFLVIAEDAAGHRGYGDCAPLAGTESEAQARDWLHSKISLLTNLPTDTALANLSAPHECPPAARCGLETALLDLLSRHQGLPLYRCLEPRASPSVRVNINLGKLDEDTGSRLAMVTGFTVVKLKVGLLPVSQDIDHLQRLAGVLADGISLRLDANRAWNMEQARMFISAVANLPVDCLEEPLRQPSLKQLAQLQKLAPFPLALDESLSQLPRQDILSDRPVDRLVLKPMRLGGLQAALALGRAAQRAALDCLVTTTVDSAVGCWAATHLAAALNAGDGAIHGLATSDWLSRDVAPPPPVRDGRIILSENSGLGIKAIRV